MKPYRMALALAVALAAGPALAQATKDKPKSEPKPAATTEKGRDWTQIDTNKDGFISPEEMDAWLKANPGPQK